MTEQQQVTVRAPGEGHVYWLVTDRVAIKATGEDTGGAYTMSEIVVPPEGGPPPHLHHREDESFFILEGEFEFLAGDRTVRASAGAFVYGPKGIPHTYKNIGGTPGRLLVTASPPGIERFVAEAGVPVTESATPPGGPPDLDRLRHVAERYGIEILLPR